MERELDPVGAAIRSPPAASRDPDRKCVRLYANDRAEGPIGLGVPAGAAPVIENSKRARSLTRDLSQEIQEQTSAAAEPPVAQL
jgi:hypothetical protein